MIFSIIGALFFLPSIILNIGLSCGAPWGNFAMNGRHKIVPVEIRRAFILPIILQFFALFILLSVSEILPSIIPLVIVKILAFFFSLYLTFYTATVLFSVSKKERRLMGTCAVIATLSYWAASFAALPF